MSLDLGHAVEFSLETVREPSPAQQAAWAALWGRLLALQTKALSPLSRQEQGLSVRVSQTRRWIMIGR